MFNFKFEILNKTVYQVCIQQHTVGYIPNNAKIKRLFLRIG